MSQPNNGEIVIEDARLLFLNFTGKEGMYNAEGDRNFCLVLDPTMADQMVQDGWNVKELRSRDADEAPTPYVQVSVKYRGRDGSKVRPPNIVMIASGRRTNLDEEACEVLDFADIANVDIIVRPYSWSMSGKSGIKAYLKSIYVTIAEDALFYKYKDIPEVGFDEMPALEAGPDDITDAESWEDEAPAIEKA